ncbi:MAG: PAS domain S-box protein, partial [Alphaproteobacteria bacterium]|nr:PAS domain S-box protein [Alphaproteobacteria bacterium]
QHCRPDTMVRPGMTLEEILRRNLRDGAYPEAEGREEEWLAERLARFAEPAGPFEQAIWNGQWLLVQDHKLADGGTITLTTDITERKQAEAALRESEARFRSIFEQSRIPTSLVSPDGRYLKVNRALSDMLGYAPAELEQMSYQDVTHPDDLDLNEPYRVQVEAGEIDSYELEKRYIRRDGGVVWSNLNVTVVRSPDGAELFDIGQHQVITERKQAEQALTESQARLYALVDNCPLIIAIKDTDGRLVYCNSAYERVMGRPLERLIGTTVFDVAPRTQAERYRAHEREVLRTGQPIVREWTNVPVVNSKRTLLDLKFPFRDADGGLGGIGYIGRDITEEKEAQATLWAAKQDAEQANSSKTRFLAAASHDLRQPLQSMALLLHILAISEDADERAQIIEDMGMSLNTMQGLLNTLLDISALEAGAVSPEPEIFPIQELLDSVQGKFRSIAGAEGLELRVVPCRLHVDSDPRLLEQIVNNFVSNAVRYTNAGRLLIGCRRRGGELEISVFDTGVGIPEDEQSAIFEDFYQLDNPARDRSKGLGLGLAIAYRTAKLLGVRLGAASNVGKGSRFSVLVPIAETAHEGHQASPPVAKIDVVDLENKFVAVIEDDAAIAKAMKLLLGKEGLAAVATATGAEMTALLAEADRTPDLVISDYRLPSSETGVEVVQAIRQSTRPDLPGIIITGDTTVEILQRIEAAGLQHLYKPVDPVALRNLIRDALTADSGPI